MVAVPILLYALSRATHTSSVVPKMGLLLPPNPFTRSERITLLVLLILAGLVILSIVIWYLLEPRAVIGDSLVNTPAGTPQEVPPPALFPLYVKPITLLFAAVVVFSYCFFALLAGRIRRFLPRYLKLLLLVVSVLFFAICVYETLFNFALLGSLMVTQSPNPDHAVNVYPVTTFRVNLAFATKSFVAYLFVTYFSVATFRSSLLEEGEETKSASGDRRS